MASGCTWHNRVFFGVHYDLHADAVEPAPAHLRERLTLVKPDWIQCDCAARGGPDCATSRIYSDVARRLRVKFGACCAEEVGQPDIDSGAEKRTLPRMLELTDRRALEARLLDARGAKWDLLAGASAAGQDGAGPPPCMKTVAGLCREVATALALGGGVMVRLGPQRSGWLTKWHHELLAEVAGFCRARKEICFKTRTASQAAVLHMAGRIDAGGAIESVEGALDALLETGRSADMLPGDQPLARMRRYKLIVVPEQTHVSGKVKIALENFARAGGRVFMTGAHLAREMPDLVGASPLPAVEGVDLPQPDQPVWLPVGNEAVGVGGPWQPVVPRPGTWVLACRLSEQDPAKNTTFQAVATRRPLGRGSILAVHGPIFRDYFLAHRPHLRRFIAELIAGLGIKWAVQVDGPPHLETVLRRRPRRLLVNLINRGSSQVLGSRRMMVEEIPPLRCLVLRIRRKRRPRAVYLAPGKHRLKWSFRDGVATVRVPEVHIHDVVVVEL